VKSIDYKKLFQFLESKKALVVCIVVAGLITLLSGFEKSESSELKVDPSVDTYIPAGFVLVPIEVQNYEALDSILGQHGVVDLFLPSPDSKRGVRVASRVKILRAPQNPSQFAVLVRDSESEQLVRSESAFFVVVQNSKQSGTGFVNAESVPQQKRKSRVISEAE
jgi:hypothetical protein